MISTLKRKGARLFCSPSNIVKTKKDFPRYIIISLILITKKKSIVVQIKHHLLISFHVFSSSKLKQKPYLPSKLKLDIKEKTELKEKEKELAFQHLPASKPTIPIRTFPT
jgi:hypothetical protein